MNSINTISVVKIKMLSLIRLGSLVVSFTCLCPFLASGQLVELGTDDFRISMMGPDSDPSYDGVSTKVAYNSRNDQYLVVWSGDDNTGPLVEGEGEVYCQLIDSDGGLINTMIRISQMGPDGNPSFDASQPAVAYNAIDNEYMVVWQADDDKNGVIDNEFEIFGIGIDSTGNPIGLQFRISDMGPDGNTSYRAFSCEIAYNPDDNEYLVVWSGDETLGALVNTEYEIFGQRLDAAGNEIGTNDFRISDDGVDGDHATDAMDPDVAYNSTDNEYLVTWSGHLDPIPPLNNTCDDEIFGQRLSSTGVEIGTNDFRISRNFEDGNCAYDVDNSTIAYNPDDNQYLVVWQGQDEEVEEGGFIFQLAKEIYGMLLDANGNLLFPDDIRYSDVGGDDAQVGGGDEFEALAPVAIYNSISKEYLIVFAAEDDIGGQVNRENEIFIQRVASDGSEVGFNDQRISDVGMIGDLNFDALFPDVAFNPLTNEYFTVFRADDDEFPLVDEEIEIFGQRLGFDNSPNNDCSQVSINVTDALIAMSGDNDFRATQSITSDASLTNTFNEYFFQAPDSFILNENFSVELGVSFTIDASDCIPSNN